MSKSSENRTPFGQRIGIWIIAIVMLGGTVSGMVMMVISAQNPALNPEQIALEKQQEEYQKQLEEYQKYLESDEYKAMMEEYMLSLRGLDGYEQYVSEFAAESVTELKLEILSEGTGATVGDSASITANYTGWMPNGKIFDSTKTVDQEAEARDFSLDGVIESWGKGLVGTRAGGVYLLTIPAALAYGEQGSGDAIPPNTPLKFLVQVVDVVNN